MENVSVCIEYRIWYVQSCIAGSLLNIYFNIKKVYFTKYENDTPPVLTLNIIGMCNNKVKSTLNQHKLWKKLQF